MRTRHWNGERWYEREHSILKRLRIWAIWIGGWEKANQTGWDPFWQRRLMAGMSLIQSLKEPTPISLFGHRITFYNLWNEMGGHAPFWMNVKIGNRYLHLSKDKAYLSYNATPWGADCWLWGWPESSLEDMEPPR